MSVYVAAKYDDCIRLLTDGASWDENGVLAKVESKVFTARTLPLAITGRGSDAVTKRLADTVVTLADEAGSVEVAIEGMAQIFRTVQEQHADFINAHDAHFDMVMAGYAPEHGLFILTIGTAPDNPTPYQFRGSWKITVGGPRLAAEVAAKFSVGITDDDKRFLKVRGVELMDAFRLAPIPEATPWGGKPWAIGAAAGGICELTTITQSGTKTELLKDYHDPIGEPINPYREHGNVSLMGNRKDRRAAKAQRRFA